MEPCSFGDGRMHHSVPLANAELALQGTALAVSLPCTRAAEEKPLRGASTGAPAEL